MRVKQNWIRLYFNEALIPGNADREKCTVVVVIKSNFFFLFTTAITHALPYYNSPLLAHPLRKVFNEFL